jgi:hypothetical protein
MKINGSEVKTKEENSKSRKTKKVRKSSGNTSKSTSKRAASKGALASADDSKTLTHQGIIGLVIAAVLIICIIIAVVFGIRHIDKSIGSSTKNDDDQTVAEQLGSGNNSSSSSASTDEEIFPGLTDNTSKNDDMLKEWEKKSLDEGDKQGADYYNRLQGTGLKKDDVSTDDEYSKIASGVVADIKTMSCDDFYAKYNKVPNKNCDVYATIQNNAKNEDPKYTDRYSDNTETWFTYNMSDSGSGFMVYVSKDSVVTDVQFAFNSPLELS